MDSVYKICRECGHRNYEFADMCDECYAEFKEESDEYADKDYLFWDLDDDTPY